MSWGDVAIIGALPATLVVVYLLSGIRTALIDIAASLRSRKDGGA